MSFVLFTSSIFLQVSLPFLTLYLMPLGVAINLHFFCVETHERIKMH